MAGAQRLGARGRACCWRWPRRRNALGSMPLLSPRWCWRWARSTTAFQREGASSFGPDLHDRRAGPVRTGPRLSPARARSAGLASGCSCCGQRSAAARCWGARLAAVRAGTSMAIACRARAGRSRGARWIGPDQRDQGLIELTSLSRASRAAHSIRSLDVADAERIGEQRRAPPRWPRRPSAWRGLSPAAGRPRSRCLGPRAPGVTFTASRPSPSASARIASAGGKSAFGLRHLQRRGVVPRRSRRQCATPFCISAIALSGSSRTQRGRAPDPQLARGDRLARGQHRPRAEHRVRADPAAVHHDRAEADEGAVLEHAAVDHREVADQHVLADQRREPFGMARATGFRSGSPCRPAHCCARRSRSGSRRRGSRSCTTRSPGARSRRRR